MTPKEKAIELVDKYWQLNYDWDGTTKEGWAKDGALIAVDEIINCSPFRPTAEQVGGKAQGLYENVMFPINYWNEVKQEIENL